MGKTRTAFIGDTGTEEKAKKRREKRRSAREEKGIRVPGLKGGERVVAVRAEPLPEEAPISATKGRAERAFRGQAHKRGRKYLEKLASIDANKKYPLTEALDAVKKASISRFDGNIELHLNLTKRGRFEVALPHTESLEAKRVEIANDQTTAKLEKGQIDFDVLVATPDFMPRLVPFAKLLGPRGLMPNPKAGTIVNDPKSAVEKFRSGTQVLQTEKDFPLIHAVVGKVSDDPNNLTENAQAIFRAIGTANIKSAFLAPTMGPGVKVAVAS